MNKTLLKLTYRTLHSRIQQEWNEPGKISTDQKLEIIMFALADICMALGTDGTEKSAEEWHDDEDLTE